MAIAYINIEDAEDGSIYCQVVYKDGFDLKSNAHQHANLVIKWMDEHLTKVHEPVFTDGDKNSQAEVGYVAKP